MGLILLNDVLTTLSYIRGETSIPSTTTNQRTEFVQRTLDEIYESFPWKFAELNTLISVVSGLATLPTNLSIEHEYNFQYEATPGNALTEVELNEININDRYRVTPGSNLFWLTANSDGTYVFNTRETIGQIKLIGRVTTPILGATIGTPFPDRMTIALGANRWVIKAQNPEADISQDEDLYQNRLAANIGAFSRNRKRREVRTLQSESGSSTGDI
jgi:hypothetical protein